MSSPSPATCGWRDGWYIVPHFVTWRDLDAIGHVNNAVYFTYFETARTRYWLDLHQAAEPLDINFIVARAECDFKEQIGLTDEIEICVRIAEMRRSSFDFVYEIRFRDGQSVAATGKVVVVLFSWKTKSKVQIDASLRSRIEDFQGFAQ